MQKLRESDGDIVIDCSELFFIDPCGLTVLASSLDLAVTQGRNIKFEYLGDKLCSYLQRMNFFNHFNMVDGVYLKHQNRNDQRGYLCELTRIAEEDRAEDVVETLAWAFTGTIQTDEETEDDDALSLFRPIKYALSELVENAVTHAKREGFLHSSVWVAAQFYQSSGSVKIAVTDNGCGFLETLKHHPSLEGVATHPKAISAALQPRVSCNRNLIEIGLSENQGVGLTTTARISRRADGGIIIFSGNGVHHDSPVVRQQKRYQRFRAIGPTWQGVGVVIDVNRENLAGIKIHELLPDEEPPVEGSGNTPNINFV